MFRAIGRLLRTIGYFFSGRLDKASDKIALNDAVVSSTYDQIISEKRNSIQTYKDAIAGMVAEREKKKIRIQDETKQIEQLEKYKAGALAKAQHVIQEVGQDPEALKQNADYIKCQAAFSDFSSTLDEKNAIVQELESDVKQYSDKINQHKVVLEGLMREHDKLKQEKHDARAEIVSAQEERKIADLLSGISDDGTDQELARMRDIRAKAKANAAVSSELAGLDSKKSEQEFLDYASKNQANSEFESLLGLAKKETTTTTSEPTPIQES
ncbi:MAG: hypothetical protein DWQ19_09450 [Crenarchaeota archaeon]|nr:MAG: hypothetical protein DWQ19_09450 [Thermoproteota archaeon]